MKKSWILVVFALASVLAECGNMVCEQSDVVGCFEECTPTIKVFSSQNLQGIGVMQQCGKDFGGIYYSFNTNCSSQIEVIYPAQFEVNEWTGIRHVNGQMKSRLCSGKCSGNLTSQINAPAAELGLWGDGLRETSVTLKYNCQSTPTVRLGQVASTSLRVSAEIFDPDNNLKQVNTILVYPDFSRATQTMYCTNKTCYLDYATGVNGTYEVLMETIDSLGPVYQYKSDSSCHFFRETAKEEVTSSMRYRFRFNLTIDPCFAVNCSDTCEGDYRHYKGFCVNGTCDYQKELCRDICNDEKTYQDYACSQGLCTFVGKANCTYDKYCSGDSCMPKKEKMGNCTNKYECLSNYCTNNYCCDEGKSCCQAHANCTALDYCNPFNNYCEPRMGQGNYCEYDAQCIENNCYHNTCCEDGEVCCIQNNQCQFLQECNRKENSCTYSLWFYLLVLAGLGLFAIIVEQATPYISQKLRKQHPAIKAREPAKKVVPPKEPPHVEIPEELKKELKKR